jgi:hypothetical protein
VCLLRHGGGSVPRALIAQPVGLAEAQVVEAGEQMIERLRSLEFTEKQHVYGIQCLLIALKKLGRTLPPDLVERFQRTDAPWEVRMYLK